MKKNNLLKSVQSLIRKKHYEDALQLLEDSVESRNCSELLVLKARILSLSDFGKYDLKDIEDIYKKALSIDENSMNVLIEIGYFYYSIMDNSQIAEKYFQKALKISKKNIEEIVIGLTKCLNEKSIKRSLEFLDSISYNLLDKKKLQSLRDELNQSYKHNG